MSGARTRTLQWVAAALLASACEGTIDSATFDPSSPSVTNPKPDGGRIASARDGGSTIDTPEVCVASSVGASPLRRMTQSQLRDTLLDLLGRDALPAAIDTRIRDIPDGRSGAFRAAVDAPSEEAVRNYVAIAEDVAALAIGENARAFVECDVGTDGCARQLIERVAVLAFRRPAEELRATVDEYLRMYADAVAPEGQPAALETTITAIFASPYFLYLNEPVQEDRREGERVRITPAALATRLSYFLWNGPPDDALRAAAASGALDDPSVVEAEVRRMMDDPRWTRGLRNFSAQWMHLDNFSETTRDDPAFTPALRDAMLEETLSFIDRTLREGDAKLATLLTSSETFGDAALAAHYGAPAPDSSGRIDLDPEQRAGVLTHASVLTELGVVYPEVHRGLWARNAFLCDPPPPPPGDVGDANFQERLSTEPCRGCHVRMDLIGFGFADFDSLGRFRPLAPADRTDHPATEIVADEEDVGPGIAGAFGGPRELAERLAASEHVERCVATQVFEYAINRGTGRDDGCAVAELGRHINAVDGDIRSLVVAIATNDAFRSRSTTEL